MADLTPRERDLLEHTVGFRSKSPGFRNHFCTGPDTDDWDDIQELCRRGLMRLTKPPTDWLGGMSVFAVTPAGKEAIGLKEPSDDS